MDTRDSSARSELSSRRGARPQRIIDCNKLLELVKASGGRPPLGREDSPVYCLLHGDIFTAHMTTNHMYLSISQVGTIFNLVDSLACGMIGVLAIAESRQLSLGKALGALNFVRRMVSYLRSIACVVSALDVVRTAQRLVRYLTERNGRKASAP